MKPSFEIRLFMVLGLLFTFALAQEENCELLFESCPENFNGDTISVPSSVIALSTQINACDFTDIIEGVVDSSAPPSIMFIIDHSHSMTGLGYQYPGNDADGARFEVTKDLVDTVYAKYPGAEVGLVVFREELYFDHRNNSLLEHLSSYDGDQSYLPLLQLDNRVQKNQLGVQAVKSLLATRRVSAHNQYVNEDVEYTDLVYEPDFNTIGNTNINVAFDAAKAALAQASNPPERQFIIFLSDGEPYPDGDDDWDLHGNKDPYDFMKGEDVPTTYTVFLHNTEDEVPSSLGEMTTNIQNNEYSTINSHSDIWLLGQTDYNSLMSLLMNNIIRPMLTMIGGTPHRMTVDKRIFSTELNEDGFAFSKRFPLESDITELGIDIVYDIANMRTGETKDTTTESVLYVKRTDDVTIPDGFSISCWASPELTVLFEGSEISVVRENMDKLDVVFNPGEENFEHVRVEITNSAGEKLDLEKLDLDQNGDGTWEGSFLREIQADPSIGDNRLQHRLVDSIVVVFRNPDLPLDTFRVSLPFNVSKSVTVQSASYHDIDADGFIDSIFLSMDNPIDDDDLEEFASLVTLPFHRAFRVDSLKVVPGGVAYLVEEQGGAEPRTNTTSDDQLVVSEDILPNGGFILGTTVPILDKVAPVITSAYLRIDGSATDSLMVSFSEPMHPVTAERPFLLRGDSGQYAAVLQPGSRSQSQETFAVIGVENAEYITPGDSIWINFASDVADEKNNIQDNPDNRRVNVSVKQVPYSIRAKAVNNPLNPRNAPVPQFIRNLGVSETRGLVVVVEPEKVLRSHIRLEGTASVYDVVKNPIVRNVPLAYDDDTKKLYFVWNGRNSSGRLVATGTYQAVLKINDNQDLKEIKTVRIGVKR
ncbi:MAG: vWA domain-containing protein [Chitinispirillaceae bacterium]